MGSGGAENRRDADDRAARCHYLPPQKFPASYHGRFTIIDYGKLTRISAGEVGAVEMRAWEVGGGESSTVCVPIRVQSFPKSKIAHPYHGKFTIIDYGKPTRVSDGQKGRRRSKKPAGCG